MHAIENEINVDGVRWRAADAVSGLYCGGGGYCVSPDLVRSAQAVDQILASASPFCLLSSESPSRLSGFILRVSFKSQQSRHSPRDSRRDQVRSMVKKSSPLCHCSSLLARLRLFSTSCRTRITSRASRCRSMSGPFFSHPRSHLNHISQ